MKGLSGCPATLTTPTTGVVVDASDSVIDLARCMLAQMVHPPRPARLVGTTTIFWRPGRQHWTTIWSQVGMLVSGISGPAQALGRPLLEREAELADLAALVERAQSGTAGLVLIEGPAGIGKTRLLEAMRVQARGAGLDVFRARGAALEQDFGFGVVRQLFESRVRSADGEGLLTGAAGLASPLFGSEALDDSRERLDASFSVLHGLYWLCANLAQARPLLLIVDDAHWADQPSLRFISFLVTRLEELPVLVALAARPREPGANALGGVEASTFTHRMQPGALSPAAVHALVRQELGPRAEQDFSEACHRVTGGNPFLVAELLRELARERVVGAREQIQRLSELTPATVASSVVLRLSRLPTQARELAEAVALLGDSVELGHAATLGELDEATACQMADALAGIDVLGPGEPLGFIHPLVRACLYAEMAVWRRSDGHSRAARLLFDARADAERVGAQLMLARPGHQAWAVASLRAAARQARGRGAPAGAIRFLRRALAEPPDDADRADILCELGFAEAAERGPTGLDPFRTALKLTEDPRRRAAIALEVGRMLAAVFYSKDAAEACQQGLDALGEDGGEVRQQLEVQLVAAGITDLATASGASDLLRRMRSRIVGAKRDDPALLAMTGCLMAAAIPPARLGADLARRALAGGHLLAENPELVIHANLALLWADELASATETCRAAADQARRRGSQIELAWALVHSTRAAYRRGALAEAEADARETLELLDANGWDPPKPYALAPLLDVMVERGELGQARASLEARGLLGDLGTLWAHNELLHSRARVRIASGQLREGLDDLQECGRRLEAWGKTRNPACIGWRSTAALAFHALGNDPEATRFAAEEIALANEFGTMRALGVAQRAAGILEGGRSGIELLRQAVATLSATSARLELARALTDLGAALRRLGRRAEALDPLRDGLDLARRCDATALVQRARAELLAAGARPRRDWNRGREALTATEERIARMAVAGMTNRDIAQDLFVTLRTVETHLTHAYQKLDIKSRNDLSAALAAQDDVGTESLRPPRLSAN